MEGSTVGGRGWVDTANSTRRSALGNTIADVFEANCKHWQIFLAFLRNTAFLAFSRPTRFTRVCIAPDLEVACVRVICQLLGGFPVFEKFMNVH